MITHLQLQPNQQEQSLLHSNNTKDLARLPGARELYTLFLLANREHKSGHIQKRGGKGQQSKAIEGAKREGKVGKDQEIEQIKQTALRLSVPIVYTDKVTLDRYKSSAHSNMHETQRIMSECLLHTYTHFRLVGPNNVHQGVVLHCQPFRLEPIHYLEKWLPESGGGTPKILFCQCSCEVHRHNSKFNL